MMNIIVKIIQIVFLCLILIACRVDANKRDSAFAQLFHSHFVDKSYMLKVLLEQHPNELPIKILTAPPKFGKSAVIDMIEKFAQIVVDNNGQQSEPSLTDNYKIFCGTPLKICADKEFIDKHLGRHPVIKLNFKVLKEINDYETMVIQFHKILHSTFQAHNYLKHNSANDNQAKYFSLDQTVNDVDHNETHIANSFIWLCKKVHNHFNKKVVILLDEYDAYFNQLAFGNMNITEVDRIIRFVSFVTGQIFNKDYLYKGFITGVVRVEGVVISSEMNSAGIYRFLGDHMYSHLYGFTSEEVLDLVKRSLRSSNNIENIIDMLEHHYGGYKVTNQNINLFNPSSIVNYLHNTSAYGTHMFPFAYTDNMTDAFKIRSIAVNGLDLLQRKHVECNIEDALSPKGIMKILERCQDQKVSFSISSFFFFLFEHGYLYREETELRYMNFMKIPNVEVQKLLARMMMNAYTRMYYFKLDEILYCRDLFNFMTPGEHFNIGFKLFANHVEGLFKNSSFNPHSENDVKSALLIFAASQNSLGILKHSNDTKNVKLIVHSSHNHVVFVEVRFKRCVPYDPTIILEDLAKDAFMELVSTYGNYIENKIDFLQQVKGIHKAVYIGVGFEERVKSLSIAAAETPEMKLITFP